MNQLLPLNGGLHGTVQKITKRDEVGVVCNQVACLMLGDGVSGRIHWPRHADLRVNNMLYRPYSRNASAKLGANARDEPASIAVMCSQVSQAFSSIPVHHASPVGRGHSACEREH